MPCARKAGRFELPRRCLRVDRVSWLRRTDHERRGQGGDELWRCFRVPDDGLGDFPESRAREIAEAGAAWFQWQPCRMVAPGRLPGDAAELGRLRAGEWAPDAP